MKNQILAAAIVLSLGLAASTAFAVESKTGIGDAPAAAAPRIHGRPAAMPENGQTADILNYLLEQSRMQDALAMQQEAIRNDEKVLSWLKTAEERRQWQAKCDHLMEEAAHLRDDYAMLAAWLLKQADKQAQTVQ